MHFYDVLVITKAIAGALKVVRETTGAFSNISGTVVCPFGEVGGCL